MAEQPKEYPILWWTKWFDETWEENKVVDYCGQPYTCRFTLDRSTYNKAKVIIFHAPRFNPQDLPNIDDVKIGKKAWVLNSLEAPKDFQIKSKWTKIFTHLWSYSFDADFVQSYFNSGLNRGSFLSSILAKPVYSVAQKNIFQEEGLAPIAWIVSSCTSENGRHFYVRQLQKYIKVDIYGHCMKNKEWPMHSDGRPYSDTEVVSPYKFYLSIENTNCNDYVSEKMERPYAVGAVPIVDGPKDYSRFMATNHSLIRFDDFATPEQLALRIHELDNDDSAYLKYLDYKFVNPTLPIESFLNPRLLETYNLGNNSWGPDERGARCGVCALAHDMAEGTYNFNPNKTIGIDQTCAFRKWAFISWGLEFYWWIIALVVFGLAVGVAAIYIALRSRGTRRCFLELALKLTPSSSAGGGAMKGAQNTDHKYLKIPSDRI